MQHNSATTHAYKFQQLHTAVGANRVGDGARAAVAEVIDALCNNADERWRWRKFNETQIKLKIISQGEVSSVCASLPIS